MIKTFLSSTSDDLFSSVATFADARDLASIDIVEGQPAARLAIKTAIGNALRHKADPSSRIALIKGDAGSGKSHVLTTSFRAAAALSTGEVYPIVLQLTAPVTPKQYETWLIDAAVRQLSARHFADDANHGPLRRLAGKLLERMPLSDQDEFQRLIDDLDDNGEISLALDFGKQLRKDAAELLAEDPPAASFIAIVMLAGYGDPSAIEYLRYGEIDERLATLKLRPVKTAHERIEILRSLGLTAQIVGASLAIGFDQVENTIRLGSEALFIHALTQAVRIVEAVINCAVIVVVLGSEYDNIVAGNRGERGLADSDRDRIERDPPRAIELDQGSPQFRRDVVAKRLTIMRQRAKISGAAGDLEPLPSWLVGSIDKARSVRLALREVALFRERAVELGRLPTQKEYEGEARNLAQPADKPTPDFDKEWVDFLDTAPTVSRKLLDTTKAQLIAWWAQEASQEHIGSDAVDVVMRTMDDEFSTPIIDITVKIGKTPVELRHLALCDAPNRNQNLRNQVERVLEASTGIPMLLRTNGFPKGPTTQVAGSLKRLKALSGQILDLGPTEWQNLQRASEFVELKASTEGFLAWKRDRKWLQQFISPLQPLIAPPEAGDGEVIYEAVSVETVPAALADVVAEIADAKPQAGVALVATKAAETEDVNRSPFPVLIGTSFEGEPVHWAPYREPPNHLNNFSLLVTGDAGSGKTQTIRVLIDAAAQQNLSIVIFDFKADYCDPSFAEPLGLEVVDVRKTGLPFNPMQPPPREASGIQPIEHAYELAGILSRVFRLGPVQQGLLKEGICEAYQQAGIAPREWIDPSTATWPPFEAALNAIAEEKGATALLTKLRPLCELGLFPAATDAQGQSFERFVASRACLKLSELPSDDIKSALAELIIVQLHGYALRGDQPRRLKHMMVFDEAHRVKASQRLESLAREGRAFGVGIVIGTQFPGDIPATMAGNLATQLFLMNNQASHRKFVVGQLLGSTSGSEAHALMDKVGSLKPLEGVFANAHYNTGAFVKILPHYQRKH